MKKAIKKYYTPECVQCRNLEPMLKMAAQRGIVILPPQDTQQEPDPRFTSVPALEFFVDGKSYDLIVGGSLTKFKQAIDDFIYGG